MVAILKNGEGAGHAACYAGKGDRDAVEAAVARLSPIDAEQAALLQRWGDSLQP